MNYFKTMLGAAAAVLALGAPNIASASTLSGEQLRISYDGCLGCNLYPSDTVTVGAGAELSSGDGSSLDTNFLFGGEYVDFTGTSIITHLTGSATLQLIVEILDTAGVEPIVNGLSLISATPGEVLSGAGFTEVVSDTLFKVHMNFDGDGGTIEVGLSFRSVTEPPVPPSVVPLPAGGVLLLGGLGALGLLRRRKA
ncbi:VPLPA-CTERM sorting domain-containing protein [Actibacterium sp. XHP0104]|uniref:VPLPA-CTERM sorting domain-containing protein n=1 Tax=Actibacterium sp. XHP0104 TaxID=2984335 RepID=UPI0021E7BB2A|nr:VPLPA-CTERM sorting domain-containing protein [Actibacterium sp. XHP0104]MCV2882443.1 VPLPA-CTERM sorting domain-containing protein [Actibacterium sp. XHP0104]